MGFRPGKPSSHPVWSRQVTEYAPAMWIEFTIALKFLRQGLAQTILILLGIGVGVSVIVFIITLVTGLQANLIDRTLGTQAHVRVEPRPDANQPAINMGEPTVHFLLEDARAQRLRSINNWQQVLTSLESLPDITAASPVVSGPAFARRADAVKAISLVGVIPER